MILAGLTGAAVITICVFIQMFGIIQLAYRLRDLSHVWTSISLRYKKMWLMVLTVHGIFFIHAAQIWVWACTYWLVDALPNLEDAVYFSTVTFSTLGYGDLTLDETWRLLGALEGIAGFIHIGWSTAYLIAAGSRYGPFSELEQV